MAFCFTISVRGAVINEEGHLGFVITNGGTTFHFQAYSDFHQQKWVTALQLLR